MNKLMAPAVLPLAIWGLILVTLVSLLAYFGWFGVSYNCFNTDFGIYFQAISNIAAGLSSNPYITIRGVHIFNDHFDPIIFLAAPIVRVFNYSPYAMITFEFMWFLALGALILKNLFQQRVSLPVTLAILTCFVFSKGLLAGFMFPIHPTVWSCVALFLVVGQIKPDPDWKLPAATFFLMLFKELYPFCLIGLSFYLLLNRQYRHVIFQLIIAGIFFFLNYVWMRTDSASVQYEGGFLSILLHPIDFLTSWFKSFHYGEWFKVFYPFIPVFYFWLRPLGKNWRDWISSSQIGIICFLFPVLLMHLLTNKIYLHYGAPFVAALLAVLVSPLVLNEIKKSKKALVLITILFITSGFKQHESIVRTVFRNKNAHCKKSPEKWKAKQELMNQIHALPANAKILTTGEVIPSLVAPGRKIYQINGYSKIQESYDYLLLQQSPNEEVFGVPSSTIQQIKSNCREQLQDKVDNKHFYLGEGPIQSQCLEGLLQRK